MLVIHFVQLDPPHHPGGERASDAKRSEIHSSFSAMARFRVSILGAALLLLLVAAAAAEGDNSAGAAASEPEVEKEAVVTLDADNFSDFVSQKPFVVIEFYAPWCGHCKKLAPEYEKAAKVLSSHDPPIVLAKIDANDAKNKELATKFEIQGFPTIKILRNQGNNVQEYKGPRQAEGIVEYLKKQAGPASSEIKTGEDASNLIDEKKIFIVGVFPKYSGSEYENFIATAEKLRSDYDFGHTLDAKLLPRGEPIEGPVVRLLKPFDELVVDHKDFEVAALEKFIELASVPLVVTFDTSPDNHPYLVKFFSSTVTKAMLFLNFTGEDLEAYKSQFHGAAEHLKAKGVTFLIGDLDASKAALQYYGLKEDQTPVLFVQENEGPKFVKANIQPDEITSWINEYMDGKLAPFVKSEPVPEVNNEPVKVVVHDSLNDVVIKSGKNVLLEFYAPWCGHCKKLAPILEEVAVSLQNEDDIVIAKMDATANDVPKEFNVQGFPTMYFSSASGKLLQYEGGRTAEEIIDFIKKNRDGTTTTDHLEMTTSSESDKDEL